MATLPLGDLGPSPTAPVVVDWPLTSCLPDILIWTAIVLAIVLLIVHRRARSRAALVKRR